MKDAKKTSYIDMTLDEMGFNEKEKILFKKSIQLVKYQNNDSASRVVTQLAREIKEMCKNDN